MIIHVVMNSNVNMCVCVCEGNQCVEIGGWGLRICNELHGMVAGTVVSFSTLHEGVWERDYGILHSANTHPLRHCNTVTHQRGAVFRGTLAGGGSSWRLGGDDPQSLQLHITKPQHGISLNGSVDTSLHIF